MDTPTDPTDDDADPGIGDPGDRVGVGMAVVRPTPQGPGPD